MKTHVVTTSADATFAEALDLMDLYQVTSLPVVDGLGRLIGMLVESDIVREVVERLKDTTDQSIGAIDWTAARLRDAAEAGAVSVASGMISPSPCIYESDLIAAAATAMLDRPFERIPVVDDQYKVVGTLARIDICQAIFESDIEIDVLGR